MERELKDRGFFYQILIFLVLAAGIIVAGYFYYQSYEQEFRQGVENQLTSVGDMKVDELARWRFERHGDARVLSENPALSVLIGEIHQNLHNNQAKEDLKTWLSALQTQYKYSRVYLINADDTIQFSSPDTEKPISATILDTLPSVRKTGEITFVDFYRDESDRNIYLTMLIPVPDDGSNDSPADIIALEIDPSIYLYPFISRWPAPSSTAETLLLRVEGDTALYLNELRFRDDTALSFRMPLNQTGVTAVKAALGSEGIVEGVDYRGVPVIAYVRAIPDSPWFLVAIIDHAEVFAPLRVRLIDLIIIIGFLLLGTGAMLYLLRKRETERDYLEQLQTKKALEESEALFRGLFDTMPSGAAIYSVKNDGSRGSDYIISDFNRTSLRIEGKNREEVVGRSLADLRPNIDEFGLIPIFQRVWETGETVFYPAKIYVDSIYANWYENYVFRLPTGQIVAIYNDVTETRRAEEALQQSEERLRLTLDATNDAVWDWNIPSGTAIFSPRWFTMLGYGPEEMPSNFETWRSLLHPDDLEQALQSIQDCVQRSEEAFTVEFRMHKKQGGWAWILARGRIIERNEDGGPIRMVGTHTDISERKKIEIALRESEEKYREFFTTSRDCVFIISPNGAWVDFNHIAPLMFHYDSPSELSKSPLSDLFGEAGGWNQFINAVNTDDGVSEYPASLTSGDGLVFDASITAAPLKNPDGTVRGYIGTIRDVTEQRQFEKRIQRERERLFVVLENMPAFVYLQSSDYTIPYANRVFHELFGEIQGRPCYEVIQNRDSPCEVCPTLEVLSTGRPAVWEWTTDEGRTFMIYDTRFPSEEQNIVLEVGIEITDLKRTEEYLKESRARLITLLHTIPDLIWLKDKDGVYLACNTGFERLIGAKEVDIIGKTDYDFFEKEIAESFREHDRKAIGAGTQSVNEEWVTFADDGHRSLLETIKTPMLDSEGRLVGVLGIGRDITERKIFEEQITTQNQRLELSQAIGHTGSWEYDLRTGNIWGSDEGFHIYGMNPPPDNKLPVDEIEACIPEHERVHQALNDLIEEKSPYNLEFTIYPADGSPERVIISIAELIKDESGTPIKVVGVIQDITSRKQAESERDDLIIQLSQNNEQLHAAYEQLAGSEEELRFQYNTLATTEEQLREKTKYLDNLITYANVPIIVWNPAYIITQANHAFENLIGRGADQLVGQSIRSLFPLEQAEHAMMLIETTKAGVRWDTVEIAIQHSEGAIKTVIWNSATLYSPDGETVLATIAQGQDITQRRRLEEENDLALKEIQKNLAQLSILNDQIRNPLMIILMAGEMIDDEKNRDLITEQIRRIDDMVNQLDTRWVESEKVLTMIRKNYQIFASPSSDQLLLEIEERTRESGVMEDGVRSKGPSFSNLAEVIQAELYTILDSIDAYVYVADLQTDELLYMNRLGRSLFGDIAGKRCFEIIQKDQDGPCSFCTNHLLTDEFGPTGVQQRELKNTRNGRWYDCRDRAIMWSNGRLVHLQIGTDITERKRIEETLRENEYTFRKLYEESSDPILLMQDDRFVECNQAALDLLLLSSKEEFIGLTPADISPEIQPGGRLSADAARELINRAHTEGRSRFDWMVQRSDGTSVLIEVSLFPIIFKGEEMLHITWRDITERKAEELASQESKDNLKRKLDAILSPEGDIGSMSLSLIIDAPEIQLLMDDFYSLTKIGVAIVDNEGKMLVATGWQDICTKFHRVHPETCKNCIESDTRLSSDIEPGTFRLYRCKNNMWDIATPIVVGGVHLGSLFLGQFLFDDELVDYAFFREQAARYGFDEEAYMGALEQVPRWSRNTVDTVMRFYTRIVHLISEASWGSIHLARIVVERDTLISTIQRKNEELETAMDESCQLTEELRERDEELRQQVDEISQARYDWEQIFQSIGSPALILDIHHRILDANSIVLERSGKTLGELKGMFCWEIFHGEGTSSPPDCCPCEEMFRSKKTETAEMEVSAFGGIFLVTCSPILSTDGSIDRIIHIALDITGKKNAENSLREVNQKLRLLTRLTRHDILNQVQIIQSSYDLIREASDIGEIKQYVSRANSSAERISSMIGFTRVYENFGSVSSDWQPVYQTIMDAVHEIKPGYLPVDTDIPQGLLIYADPIIRKVFVNLIENAVRHGGAITSIRFSCRIEGNVLKIFCDDDGIGVPPEEKEHIFDQGYGKNTGVGLFLSKEILSITGLSIRECGIFGEGARFEISVPAGRFRLNNDMPSPR